MYNYDRRIITAETIGPYRRVDVVKAAPILSRAYPESRRKGAEWIEAWRATRVVAGPALIGIFRDHGAGGPRYENDPWLSDTGREFRAVGADERGKESIKFNTQGPLRTVQRNLYKAMKDAAPIEYKWGVTDARIVGEDDHPELFTKLQAIITVTLSTPQGDKTKVHRLDHADLGWPRARRGRSEYSSYAIIDDWPPDEPASRVELKLDEERDPRAGGPYAAKYTTYVDIDQDTGEIGEISPFAER